MDDFLDLPPKNVARNSCGNRWFNLLDDPFAQGSSPSRVGRSKVRPALAPMQINELARRFTGSMQAKQLACRPLASMQAKVLACVALGVDAGNGGVPSPGIDAGNEGHAVASRVPNFFVTGTASSTIPSVAPTPAISRTIGAR